MYKYHLLNFKGGDDGDGRVQYEYVFHFSQESSVKVKVHVDVMILPAKNVAAWQVYMQRMTKKIDKQEVIKNQRNKSNTKFV